MSNLSQLYRKKSVEKIIADAQKEEQSGGLLRILGTRDLVSLGVAAIVGAGIFSTIGRASFEGGPAVALLFAFTAVACVFTALCYAQFASTVPVSGSAYTYAYVTFGELAAWIIGWALILEYAVSNMVVAISWSEYFVSMLRGFGIDFPRWLSMNPGSAYNAWEKLQTLSAGEVISIAERNAAAAYQAAPTVAGIKIIFDLPAGIVTLLVTWLCYVGIKESRNASNVMVIIKVGVVLLVIIAGAFFVKPENWSPFAPNGVNGVLKGVAAVFFAYIGFDSISTTAEECKNPQQDMPRAMIYTLLICTVLYILIALVLTGMVSYKELFVDDPLAFVFQQVGFDFMAGVISVSAVVAITSALLVYQLGQPRIWMAMSRDGLLWKRFSQIHPRYKTPGFATIITGFVVGIPALFFDMGFFVDLTSVGTFFAFILVCCGVLYMDYSGLSEKARFKVPRINGRYIIGTTFLLALVYILTTGSFTTIVEERPLMLAFWIAWFVLSVAGYRYQFSLLPVLGILTNLYLMTELGASNWTIFLIWLAIGLVIYFAYGYRKSKLAEKMPE